MSAYIDTSALAKCYAGTRDFATADKIQANAAQVLGFIVHRFN